MIELAEMRRFLSSNCFICIVVVFNFNEVIFLLLKFTCNDEDQFF